MILKLASNIMPGWQNLLQNMAPNTPPVAVVAPSVQHVGIVNPVAIKIEETDDRLTGTARLYSTVEKSGDDTSYTTSKFGDLSISVQEPIQATMPVNTKGSVLPTLPTDSTVSNGVEASFESTFSTTQNTQSNVKHSQSSPQPPVATAPAPAPYHEHPMQAVAPTLPRSSPLQPPPSSPSPSSTNTTSAALSIPRATSVPKDSTTKMEVTLGNNQSDEVQAREGSTESQDDMDLDLDDGFVESTILDGSWKTTIESPVAVSSVQVGPLPTTLNRISNTKSSFQFETHSAPPIMSNTPGRPFGHSEFPFPSSRPQRTARRATAMDFILRVQQPVPFVAERALPYLIDLDDEDGDEIGHELGHNAATDHSYSVNSRPGPERPRQTFSSLDALQQQLNDLNNRIRAKELQKQSAAALTQTSRPTSQPTSQPASRPTSHSPVSTESVAIMQGGLSLEVPVTKRVQDEYDQLRSSLNEHAKDLDLLRAVLVEDEQEAVRAMDALESSRDATAAESVVLEEREQSVVSAKAFVALKLEELKRAEGLLAESERLLHSSQQQRQVTEESQKSLESIAKAARAKLEERKNSVADLQREIIRKRTRLMILEPKMAMAPSEKKNEVQVDSTAQSTPSSDMDQEMTEEETGM